MTTRARAAAAVPSPPPPRLSPDDISSLLDRIDAETKSAREDLEYAESIVQASGLTVYSSVLDAAYHGGVSGGAAAAVVAGGGSGTTDTKNDSTAATETAPTLLDLRQEAALALQARHKYNPMRGTLSAFPLVLSTTGGYCNTDHIVPVIAANKHGDDDDDHHHHSTAAASSAAGCIDKLSEYKRTLRRRSRRQAQREERGSDRWDLPRIPGGRRRRIHRDVDAVAAPPEPPASGYVIFVSQRTTKMRRDRFPEKRSHDQIAAIRRISIAWKCELTSAEREHYVRLAREGRAEYEERLVEYRATGRWSPFTAIARLTSNKNGVECGSSRAGGGGGGTSSHGPWVRIPYEAKNALEREIETYEQVIFPPRPAELEKEHETRRVEERKTRRREKEKRRKLEEEEVGAVTIL